MKNKNITFGTYMLDWYMIYKYPKHAITTRNICKISLSTKFVSSILFNICTSLI